MKGVASALITGSLLFGCSPHPTETELTREFADHKEAFDGLADMAEEDSHYSRIARNFTHPNWSLPEDQRPGEPLPARWAQYRNAFEQLGLESGITNYHDGSIVLERSSSGLVTSGSSMGFMRTDQVPEGVIVLNSSIVLDCDLGSEGWCSAAKHLDGNWYLLIERH